MTFTGAPNVSTQDESQSQQTATPISQRGSGQSVLFTPLQDAQVAAAQISQQHRQAASQQQQSADGSQPVAAFWPLQVKIRATVTCFMKWKNIIKIMKMVSQDILFNCLLSGLTIVFDIAT